MRWDDFRRSDNVEDDRGSDTGGGYGGGIGIPGGGGGLGLGTVVILGLVGWALGIDPSVLIGGAQILTGNNQGGYEQPERPRASRTAAPDDQMGQFVSAVLGDTEDTWTAIFQESGQTYKKPKLRLYSGQTSTQACGMAQAAMGPFYCPGEQRVFLDTSFFQEMQTRFHACTSDKACQFAEAYVIAHEIGHHVQNQLGLLSKARQAQESAGSRAASNHIQVQVELQADCFGGVWANRSNARRNFIDPGDVDQALQTASAIGDDRLQKQMQGRVVPDSFTHGTSEQRKRWFLSGFNNGKISACNTFGAANL